MLKKNFFLENLYMEKSINISGTDFKFFSQIILMRSMNYLLAPKRAFFLILYLFLLHCVYNKKSESKQDKKKESPKHQNHWGVNGNVFI